MAIAVVKFNGFEGIQVMDANSMNVIANEAVQFFALRNAPDEDLLLKLQKKACSCWLSSLKWLTLTR